MNNRLIVHAGPKRTASTWLQYMMVRLISSSFLDKTANEGNSHGVALSISRNNLNYSDSITDEVQNTLTSDMEKFKAEVNRLKIQLASGGDVILSSELFSSIDPVAVETALQPLNNTFKKVIFVYRDTNSLLKSLFSNSVVGGYRGTVSDFIEDVSIRNMHFYDIFTPIEKWKSLGWNIEVINFLEGGDNQYCAKFIQSLTSENISVDEIKVFSSYGNQISNKSLTPEMLFRISQINNALHENPVDLRDACKVHKFINQIIVPFFRDSPYTEDDFNPIKNLSWKLFVKEVSDKRNLIFYDFY